MQDHGWQVSDCTAEGLKVCKARHACESAMVLVD